VTLRVAVQGLDARRGPLGESLDRQRWQELRTTVGRHRLDGLLVAAVVSGDVPTDSEQRHEAAVLEVDLTRDRMMLERRTADEIEWLGGEGIEVRLLKGSALAHLDYPDPQMRPTSDIDLLVRGDQLDEAVARLTDRGAVRVDPDPVPGYSAVVGKGATLVSAGGLEIDLHRLLVWGPLGVRLPAADLWRTHRSFVLDGRTVRTLGLEETLLHTCYHLLISGWRRALSLRDVGQLLASPGLDPERATRLARRWGAEAVLAAAVEQAVTELELVEPGALTDWARGYPATARDRLWLRLERPEAPLPGLEGLATFIEFRSRAERTMLATATLHPESGTWPRPRDRLRRLAARVTLRGLSTHSGAPASASSG
jgi:hypothetical protein